MAQFGAAGVGGYLLGGRQSARTLHFIVAWILVLFVLIHVFEVIVTGFWNNLRSMITGRYRISSRGAVMRSRIAHPSILPAQALTSAGAALLAGCDALSNSSWFPKALGIGEHLSSAAQHLVTSQTLDGSGVHRGRPVAAVPQQWNCEPEDGEYQALAAHGFQDWKPLVDGLVQRSRRVHARAAARDAESHTDHAPRLRRGMECDRQMDRRAAQSQSWRSFGSQPEARYVVFHCADPM